MTKALKANGVTCNNRKRAGTFSAMPHHVQDSKTFISLTPKAVKLLMNMLRDYNGSNNGDIACTFKMMQRRGWNSDQHMRKARDELLKSGMIVLTRLGDRRKPNLYAFTWLGIHECDGKLDVKSSPTPLGFWKDGMNLWL